MAIASRLVKYALNTVAAVLAMVPASVCTSAARSARVLNADHTIAAPQPLDPAMLDLNRRGYLNGHTPFSAYLAFLAATCAVVYGHRHVIVSNERSCDEPAAHYLGADVVHQYSKTYRFEALVAEYVRRHLAAGEKIPRHPIRGVARDA